MEKQAANILLGRSGEADRFDLKWGFITFHLQIKPLTARQVIDISGELSSIGDYDSDMEMFPVLMQNSNDLTAISMAIAIATGTKHKRAVAKAIRNLPLEDIKRLFQIVYKQTDPTPFFFITVLAKGRMNLMEKRKE
jgi:hypothetical protein